MAPLAAEAVNPSPLRYFYSCPGLSPPPSVIPFPRPFPGRASEDVHRYIHNASHDMPTLCPALVPPYSVVAQASF